MNNELNMPVSPEEAKLIEIIRRYKSSYADFKVEMRYGKITRVLPTFSELISVSPVHELNLQSKPQP